jgi:hypothetical protein
MGTKTYVVQVEVSRSVMVQYWGHPCREKHRRGCPACKAWERWRKTKQIVVTATEAGTLKILIGLEK